MTGVACVFCEKAPPPTSACDCAANFARGRVRVLEAALREIAEGVPYEHKGACYAPCSCCADAMVERARLALVRK